MSAIINHSLDWPRSQYANILLVPIYVVTGIAILELIINILIRLIWWNHRWQYFQTMKRIDQKIISYAFHNFFVVLEGREAYEHIKAKIKHLKKMELQIFGDEVDAEEAEKSIRNILSSIKVNKDSILKSKHAINLLSMYLHMIILLVFTTFWDTFIVEETFGCDEHRDCYVGDNSEDPICDCDLINPKNTSVICYRLLFDSINGLTSVGGITFVAIGGFGLMSYLVLLVQDAVEHHCIRVFLSIIVFVLQYTLLFASLGYFIYFHVMRSRLHQAYQVTYIVQVCITFVAAFICVTTPWIIIVWSWILVRAQQAHILESVPDQPEPVSTKKECR